MKTLIAVILFSLPALAKVNVVATLPDLGAIAREVGGDAIHVDVLARPSQDPHFVDAKPSLVLSLAHADLLVLNGLELEIGWLPVLLTSSRNGAIQPGNPGYLDCSTVIAPKEVPLQKLDRSMGDIHPGGNPHYTYDPRNAIPIARAIADRLGKLDPSHEQLYQANAQNFERALTKKIAEWQKALAPFRGTPIVTYHQSWIYFCEFAGLDQVAYLEPKPGIPPNPTHVAQVFQIIQSRKVPVLLQEDWYSSQTGELLARKSSATLVKVSGMTRDHQTYIGHIDEVVRTLVQALNKSRARTP